MAEKTRKSLRWLRLDNAAKIYPAARRKNWSNVFRQSVTLYDDVDADLLQGRYSKSLFLHRGPFVQSVFWYYLPVNR